MSRSGLAKTYTMRVYVPFGDAWYGYLMRRLAERPANIAFFAKSLTCEKVNTIHAIVRVCNMSPGNVLATQPGGCTWPDHHAPKADYRRSDS